MADIVIVDLDAGNLHSVRQAVARVAGNRKATISAEPQEITTAKHLILPGQSALGAWLRELNKHQKLNAAVVARLQSGPVLGICLGLQALYQHSEEDNGLDALGLLEGSVKKFTSAPKVPHMGWNRVRQTRAHPLWQDIAADEYFYFAHSYFVAAANAAQVAGVCEYGTPFAAAAAHKNIFAVQFHPEKSQRAGLQLLRNFINWNGEC